MIDKAIYAHLCANSELSTLLTRYAGKPAIFHQEAPADTDPLWANGPQYGRLIFALDVQNDPARKMGGSLSIDVQCESGKQLPETYEPLVRSLVDGYFFTDEGHTMAAQWVDSRYFSEPNEQINGVTLLFELLAIPMRTTVNPDVIERLNEWTALSFPKIVVLNREVPAAAWKPSEENPAIYWRVHQVQPAGWIPDTHQTIWRTAVVMGHVFAVDGNAAAELADQIVQKLYYDRRLLRQGESPIMVDRNNSIDMGADALRTGQITVEATYGVIVYRKLDNLLNHIYYVWKQRGVQNGTGTRTESLSGTGEETDE